MAIKRRLAVIVSHPIQYYVPLYRRLAQRDGIDLKVFFTWHRGAAAVEDRGFGQKIAWDIPLTEGYESELVNNLALDPGTHHFLGLINPSLVDRVMQWRPDVVHITGWASLSHMLALRAFRRRRLPVLFRGDSHLLNERMEGARWRAKKLVLGRVYSWPSAFLMVGSVNRAYYQAFGVSPERLLYCPHSIDVDRFAEPADALEQQAGLWRRQLGIAPDQCVLLFAGKLERQKGLLNLMRAVQALADPGVVLVVVGAGALESEVAARAAADKQRFRLLPFQNQSRMPVVYRLADLFVLPSFGETWGLAVNEALACARPVLVSDRVGCASDLVDASCGAVFSSSDASALSRAVAEMTSGVTALRGMRKAALARARRFDLPATEETLVAAIHKVCG